MADIVDEILGDKPEWDDLVGACLTLGPQKARAAITDVVVSTCERLQRTPTDLWNEVEAIEAEYRTMMEKEERA